MRALILFSAFVSGFVVMTLELLGGRLFSPWFGTDVYVWGSLISVFMAALSAGYLLGGKLSVRQANFQVFALIFLAAAITILPVVLWATPILEAVANFTEDVRLGSLLGAFLLFVVPSTIMGMVSPYSVRLLTVSRERSGESAGFLYFVSTLGSALGTLITSFYLVAWFDIDHVVIGTVIAMAACGVLLLLAAPKEKQA